MEKDKIIKNLNKEGFVEIGGSQLGEVWKPMFEGDTLKGEFLGSEDGVGKNKNSMIHSIMVSGGDIKKVWGATVLDDRLSKVEPGEEVAIIWWGKKKTKKGNDCHSWGVFHNPKGIESAVEESNI